MKGPQIRQLFWGFLRNSDFQKTNFNSNKSGFFRLTIFFSILLESFLFVKGASAATYYVDNSCTAHNGNGSCNGTDPNCQCAGSDNGDGPFNSIANMQASRRYSAAVNKHHQS